MKKAALNKGDFFWHRSGNIVACKQKDKMHVLTINNKFTNPEMVPVTNRCGDQEQKSSIV